jgi:acetyl-CoA carboxylase biotin carboxyl carrier protein
MDPQQIKAFIDAMAASDFDELEVSHDGWTLRLVRHARGVRQEMRPAHSAATERAEAAGPATPAAGTARAAEASGPEPVRASMFGVVHLQQAAGEPPFVQAGDLIAADQLLCTIEAMKVFNEVRAEFGGRVAAVLVTSGSEVEAGQALFAIDRTAHV